MAFKILWFLSPTVLFVAVKRLYLFLFTLGTRDHDGRKAEETGTVQSSSTTFSNLPCVELSEFSDEEEEYRSARSDSGNLSNEEEEYCSAGSDFGHHSDEEEDCCFVEPDSDEAEESLWNSWIKLAPAVDSAVFPIVGESGDMIPSEYFRSQRNLVCRFINGFYNCWMNATLQAVLSLGVVQQKVRCPSPEVSIPEPITPEFGKLFFTALTKPGKTFFPQQIKKVLVELSEKIPILLFGEFNDPLDLLQPLLTWLEKCGVTTVIEKEANCEQCGISTLDTTNWSNIYFLPLAGDKDSISSLFKHFLDENTTPVRCKKCGATATKEPTLITPDLLTLFLPRDVKIMSRQEVMPCESLKILTSDTAVQRYRLSSVVCQKGFKEGLGHYWTYLLKNGFTIEADGPNVNIEYGSCRPDEIYNSGMIYFYERCS